MLCTDSVCMDLLLCRCYSLLYRVYIIDCIWLCVNAARQSRTKINKAIFLFFRITTYSTWWRYIVFPIAYLVWLVKHGSRVTVVFKSVRARWGTSKNTHCVDVKVTKTLVEWPDAHRTVCIDSMGPNRGTSWDFSKIRAIVGLKLYIRIYV